MWPCGAVGARETEAGTIMDGVDKVDTMDQMDDGKRAFVGSVPIVPIVRFVHGGPAMSKPENDRAAGSMRIAKAMARAGLCSRRDAERWIGEGRVTVDGKVLTTPARDVTAADDIHVDGRPLPLPEPVRLWRYHKPRGLVTTHRDPQGRPTVFQNLPKTLPRVVSIGRLDFNTEGLLLLTNDGELARHIELPATGWLRRYRVRAHGRVRQSDLDRLGNGIELDGVRYGPITAKLDSEQGSNVWLTIGLREGKTREVRTVLEHLGLTVNRLIRVSFGPFQLLDLAPGDVERVKSRVLADQLGTRLARLLHLTDPARKRAGRPPGGREESS
ncbi:MAG: pseudouridine synthase [Hyphomicrobiaceae bacterium]